MNGLLAAIFGRWRFSGGAAAVFLSAAEAALRGRHIVPAATYAEATNSCTWEETENVTEIYLTLTASAGSFQDSTAGVTSGAPQVEKSATVVFDALSSSHAELLLAEGGASGDGGLTVQKVPLVYGKRTGPFTGASYFSRLDIDVPVGGELFVEAS